MSVEQVTLCLRFLLCKFLRTWQHPGEGRGQQTNTSAAFSAFVMSWHVSLPTTWSVSEVSISEKEKMVQGHRVCKWQAWLPRGTPEPTPASFHPSVPPLLGAQHRPWQEGPVPLSRSGSGWRTCFSPRRVHRWSEVWPAAGSPARDPLPGRCPGSRHGL